MKAMLYLRNMDHPEKEIIAMWNFVLTQSGVATHDIDYTAAVPLLVGELVLLVALCAGLIALVAWQRPNSPCERRNWSSARSARNR